MRRFLIILGLCIFGLSRSFGQEDAGNIYIVGDEVTVKRGTVRVMGSYQDDLGTYYYGTTNTPTGSLANGGTVYIGRNIINNSDYAISSTDAGTIVMDSDTIVYLHGQDFLFHNLFLEMDTSVHLYQTIDVTDSLLMTSGFINLDSSASGVNLGAFGQVYGENNSTYFYGELGNIIMTDRALSGMLDDISGTGFSLNVNGSLGTSRVERFNGKHSGTANGSIYRFYKLIPANTGTLYSAGIKYLAHEVGEVDEGQITMWQSDNAGVIWSQLQSDRYGALDSVAGFDATISANEVLLTLADSICNGDKVPVVNLGPDLAVCEGDPVTLDAGNPGLFFLWSTGETTQTISVNQENDYWVLVTNANGCVGADTVFLAEKSYPDVDFDAEFADYVCQGNESTFTNNSTIIDGSELTYFWDFGDLGLEADTSIIETPTFLYDTAGLYQVKLVATSEFNCADSVTKDYVVHPLPQPMFDFDSLCLNEQNVFTDQSTILPNIGLIQYAIASWDWDFGDPTSTTDVSSDQSPTYTYPLAGGYQVRLALESYEECRDTLIQNVLVDPLVEVDFLGQNLCIGEEVNFTNTSDLAFGEATYEWDFGDDNTSTEENPVHVYENHGTYNVLLEATTDEGCVTNLVKSFEAFTIPEPDFTVTNVCVNTDIDIVNQSMINSSDDLDFFWDFGDGSTSTLAGPAKTYAQPGDYEISLEVTSDNNCVEILTRTVTIYPEPVASFNFQSACVGDPVRFFNVSSIGSGSMTYEWDFRDGNTSTAQNPEHTFEQAGTYFVLLTVESEFGCAHEVAESVEVYELPVIDIQPEISTCADMFVLDAGNPGSTYAWQDNANTQTYTVTESGTYTVQVINANGCFAEATTQVTLESIFEPNLNPTATGCDVVVLDGGNSGAQSYLWSTGETTREIEVTSSDTYTVDITDQNGCPGSQAIEVTVYMSPTVDLGPDAVYCADETVTIDAGNAGSTFEWSNGLTSQVITVTESGTYSVDVTNPDGCVSSDEIQITINDLPVVDLEEDRQACDEITLDAGNPGSTYKWQDESIGQTYTVTESGTYSVEVTTPEGCVFSDEVVITVEQSPLVDLGPNIDICSGESAVLDAGNSGAQFAWSGGSTDQTLEVFSSGFYEVTVTNSLGCSTSDIVEITVHSNIDVDLGPDQNICIGNEVTVDAGFGGLGYTYQWFSSSTGFSSTDQAVTLMDEDLYWVNVTTDVGCVGTDSIRLNVATDTLKARYLVTSLAEVFDTVSFISLSVPIDADHLWMFGNGIQSTIEDPLHIYTRPGVYETSLQISNEFCSDDEYKTVTIVEESEEDEEQEETSRSDNKPTQFVKADIVPNPNRGFFVLDLEMSKEGGVNLTLLDSSGEILQERSYKTLSELNDTFDIRRQAAGIYLLRITTADNQKTLRILKN